MLFDLMRTSALLREHAKAGRIGFGINHEMTDFSTGKHKNLDLVICIPSSAPMPAGARDFAKLPEEYGIALSATERHELDVLPPLKHRTVGTVLIATEAKAAMTKHTGAGPRFNDELTSAFQCINGSAQDAIAVGFGMVNAAPEFVSTDSNKTPRALEEPKVNKATQPSAAMHIIARMRKLRVRSVATDVGFDATGLLTIRMRNDGTPVEIVESTPAVPANDSLNYEMMIRRVASIYHSRFASL